MEPSELTLKEAAELCRCSKQLIQHAINSDQLASRWVGPLRVVSRSDVLEWNEARLKKGRGRPKKEEPEPPFELPLYEDAVPCGPAADIDGKTTPAEMIRLDRYFGTSENLFVTEADGESMIAAGILSGDLLIWDAARTARKNDIVMLSTTIDGEDGVTVAKRVEQTPPLPGHRYQKCDGKRVPTFVDPGEKPAIAGVLVGVVRKMK